MKIAIACDHGGYRMKEDLKKYLEELGHSTADFGTDSEESVDYPDFGLKVAESVARGIIPWGS